MTRAGEVESALAARSRWRTPEILFWLIAAASIVWLPSKHLILADVAILGLFALSLDLVLGYAGILSLGQAAFFGFGAYAAGLLAKYAIVPEPVIALLLAGLGAAALGLLTSFLLLRGSDLTRLMVTLGVALVMRELANKLDFLTGGADGLQGIVVEPVLGLFVFDITGHVAYTYSLGVLFVLFVAARRLTGSPFGLSVRAVKSNPVRAAAIGIPVKFRLIALYTVGAGYAGIAGGLLTQTTQFASLDVLSVERSADVLLVLVLGGPGYLYGGVLGAIGYKLAQDSLITLTAQYWQFWIGLILVVIVLAGDRAAAVRTGMQRSFEHLRPRLDHFSGRLFWSRASKK